MPASTGPAATVSFQQPGKIRVMTKVLVLYYSSYGHIETMAEAVAEGVREGRRRGDHQARAGARCRKRSPGNPTSSSTRPAPIATVDELADYDAIIIGAPTRFGNMPAR